MSLLTSIFIHLCNYIIIYYQESHLNILDYFLFTCLLYILVFIVAKYLDYFEPQKQKKNKE